MAPAGRALALVTALAVAAAGGGPAVAPARAQDRARAACRSSATPRSSNCCATTPTPILRAAGLAKQNVRVVILNDRAFNAFVMDGRHIFINAGALFDAKTPNEIIGVFAHETGHLAGGHLQRLREQLATAQTASIIAMLAGVGAMVAGARSGGGDVGAAAIMAPQSAIQRSLLAYVRTQEDQADHAGVKFLTATGQSARGMLELFKRLGDESLFNSRYHRSLSADRTRCRPNASPRSKQLAKASPYFDRKDPPELQLRHDMMRAKLSGFLDRPDTVARRYPLGDHSLPARYARAISTYRYGDARDAIAQIDGLIQTQPNNPYFYELKGQALLEGGHPAEAIAPLRRAVALAHGAPLIDIMLGQALIATNNTKYAEEAVPLLQRRAQPRTGIVRRLCPARHGLWPQGRSRPSRPRLRAGRLHARRRQDGASARERAPRPACRSARPPGCAPTISSASSRRAAANK